MYGVLLDLTRSIVLDMCTGDMRPLVFLLPEIPRVICG
jgi:hypothetical protein